MSSFRYSRLIEFAREIVQHILINWSRYAFIDNPNCALVRITAMLDGKVNTPRDRATVINYVVQLLEEYGFRVEKRRHNFRSRKVTDLLICRG